MSLFPPSKVRHTNSEKKKKVWQPPFHGRSDTPNSGKKKYKPSTMGKKREIEEEGRRKKPTASHPSMKGQTVHGLR